ncbi:hypothetical protein NE686_17105 [Tissierella carlieri]|uniref:Uncharacterized protein n=1 Tax=Tissierella carlieri TaxID=689904 RepID=A0ABT1SEC6_9FIRM|nr:hypothetical protein [Tissierella carlieri]MCQ4924823.1 hypothetical protein [Tissierella carlieri]
MQKSQIVGRDKVQDSLFTTNKDITVSKSPFSAFESNEESELVLKGRTTYMNAEQIALQVNNGYLKIKDEDTTDLEILKALVELEFATSRMITIYLNLTGTYIHQEKIQTRLKSMTKLKVLSCYEFKSKGKDGKEKYSHASVYFLDIASVYLLKSQGINTSFKLETVLKSKNGIKEILARNQLMLIYVERIKNINYTRNNPLFKVRNGEDYQPHLEIAFDFKGTMHYMLFEIIRSYDGWRKNIVKKLYSYKLFIENFTPSKRITQLPNIVLVAEDDLHAYDVMNLILENDLMIENGQYLFSTDNRLVTSDVVNSMFRISFEDEDFKTIVLKIALFDV